MKQEYRSKMYELTYKPQWKILGKERGYNEVVSEGGNYKCFQYHMAKRKKLLDEVFACELGEGKYADFSKEEREAESKRLREAEEAHHLKAKVFATFCGYILC